MLADTNKTTAATVAEAARSAEKPNNEVTRQFAGAGCGFTSGFPQSVLQINRGTKPEFQSWPQYQK